MCATSFASWAVGGVGGAAGAVEGGGKSGELLSGHGPCRIKWSCVVMCRHSRPSFIPVPDPSERRRRGDDDDFGLSLFSRSCFDIFGGFSISIMLTERGLSTSLFRNWVGF